MPRILKTISVEDVRYLAHVLAQKMLGTNRSRNLKRDTLAFLKRASALLFRHSIKNIFIKVLKKRPPYYFIA